MTAIRLEVNGREHALEVEPRTHLADLLRGQLSLTGTHLGCEQGVCGACTVLIDGRPQRSCITFAPACDGARITTIEGFDDEPLMAHLREAFSAFHGLQCGFCTPGMLIAAHDLIRRRGETDSATIRRELSGNLCRCTGYVGIVQAVESVAAGRTAEATQWRTEDLQPAPILTRSAPPAAKAATAAPPSVAAPSVGLPAMELGENAPSMTQSITVAAAAAAVWAALADVERVAACLPGAAVEKIEGEHLWGYFAVGFGPIRARFQGEGRLHREEATMSGVMTGRGRDAKGGSTTAGEVTYRLEPGESADKTRIELTIRYRLTGALAQFGRSTLMSEFARSLTQSFARNLEALIAGAPAPRRRLRALNPLTLLWQVLRARLFGRR